MSDIPYLFDLDLLAVRRARALEKFGTEGDFLLVEAASDMQDRLRTVVRNFPKAVELFGHTGILAQALEQREGTEQVLRLEQKTVLPKPEEDPVVEVRNAEILPFEPQSIDLIVSPLFLHWINDLPGFLFQVRNCLVPDGLFMATLLGRESLRELREVFLQAESEITSGASPHVAPLPDLKDMGSLLQRAGFALPVADQDILTVRYDSLFDLMKDLRRMGATNILADRSRSFLRRDVLLRAAELYQQNHSDTDGRIRATFQILSLSGWAPHESQQKPLKPGSAKTSLTSILKDKSEGA